MRRNHRLNIDKPIKLSPESEETSAVLVVESARINKLPNDLNSTVLGYAMLLLSKPASSPKFSKNDPTGPLLAKYDKIHWPSRL